ncbi:MAG: hypothetical protein ABW219_00930 [Ilumatobacteraceae bacterium]
MKAIEPLALAIVTGRRIGKVPLLLRVLVAAGALTAIVGTVLPATDVPNAYVVLAGIFAVVWTIAPDTHAGLVFLGFLGMAWVTGAPGEVDPAAVVTALGLLVAHVAAAIAAAMPVTAGVDPRLLLRWVGPTAVIAGAVLVAAAVVAAFEAWSPAGSIVVTLIALTLVTAAAWWWSTPPDRSARTAGMAGTGGTDGGRPVDER